MKQLRILLRVAILALALASAASCPQQSERVYPEALGRAPVAQAGETGKETGVVYVTKTGQKYHRLGCKYLAKSRTELSLADAKAAGYEPCSVCDPPK